MHTLQCPARLGMVDLLLGLIAALSNELRSRQPSQCASIRPDWFFQSLVQLGQEPAYADDLRGLDEGSFGAMLSQMKTWRLVAVEDGGRGFIMTAEQTSRRLGLVARQHDVVTLLKLRQMATDLLNLPQPVVGM